MKIRLTPGHREDLVHRDDAMLDDRSELVTVDLLGHGRAGVPDES